MSNIYIQEPPTAGKVVMKTSVGDIDVELWTKEAPKACRNFIQLCMEGYYDGTIFHRIVKGFIVQGGDPTGTGEGGESVYEHPFKDEFHTRLRFCRRGLLAMANAGKDDNGSQFFFTLNATPELQNKHTIFGKVTGETIYNMLKLEDALVDANDRPQYPQKIFKTEVLNNPFQDIIPRISEKKEDSKERKKNKKTGVKNFKLLSFGEEAEEDEEESSVLNKQYSGKGKSAHDCLSDPKLSSQSVVEPAGPPSKKIKEDRSSDRESDDETQTPEELAVLEEEKGAMKERIKNKLKDSKKISESKSTIENDEKKDENINEDVELDEYYFGKDRDEERKKKAIAIRKEIRELKRSVQNAKKTKELDQKQQTEKEENKSEVMKEYKETQEKYKKAKEKLPKKGKMHEDFTMELFKQFRSKLQNAKEHTKDDATSSDKKTLKDTEDDDPHDKSWLTHVLHCEEKAPVLAKDASTKDDDWFEIYDPRNPLNKRRRGEQSHKSKIDKGGRSYSHHKND